METVVISSFPPYDGRYELDFEQINTQETGWIKRLTDYLAVDYDKAIEGGDPEILCALTVIALHRAGKITPADVRPVYERLILVPLQKLGEMVQIESSEPEEDADPLSGASSSESNGTSGIASPPSLETSAGMRPRSGTTGSATSGSESETWAS